MTRHAGRLFSLRRLGMLAALAWAAVSAAALGDGPAKGDPDSYGRAQFDPVNRDHWSFVPVKRPDVPAVQPAERAATPVDAFLLEELVEAGLDFSPPADNLTQLRRAYLDLIGLPPTPAEQAAYLADDRADAYARLIEDLLARPEYGERWGRHWLDVVRYAESNGYERDNAKPNVWRYRDYVIDAFNADKPYNRFVLEQLAGDELDGANAETHIATTFLRLGVWDDEPADPMVDRYDQLDDLVGATASTFLAQSLRCARCHDHKFEQFSQRDYTRLLAVFEPLKRPQNDRNDLDRIVGSADELAAYERSLKEIVEKMAEVRRQAEQAESETCRRLAQAGLLREPTAPRPLAADSRSAGQTWRYTFDAPAAEWAQPSFDDATWPQGPGGFGNPDTPGTKGPDGTLARTVWNGERIWLRRTFDLASADLEAFKDRYPRLMVHHDDEVEVYFNGVLALQLDGFTVEYGHYEIEPGALAALKPGANVLAVTCHQTTGGQYIDAGFELAPLAKGAKAVEFSADVVAALVAEPAARDDAQKELVKKHRDPLRKGLAGAELSAELARFEAFDKQIAALEAGRPPEPARAYIWYEDSPQAGKSKVFRRGDPRSPQEEVSAGFPAILTDAPPPSATPRAHSTGRRRQFAEWLALPEHPLTARVMANRVWQHHFGDGLVSSENDFGVMGAPPTHPKLLDWLAAEFMARNWSIKELHRLIMLSNAYRQSALGSEASLAKDPRGELHSRWLPRRLEAEAVRDAILTASGQLNPKRGGPSVFPKISEAVLAGQSRPGLGWTVSDPVEASRRSVYVFVKRTLLVPELEVMDFPDTNGSCEQRAVSTVAPQALTYLNGEFMQQQAAKFATRLTAECADEDSRIRRAFELTVSRPPSADEIDAIESFLANQRRQIEADAAAAQRPAEQVELRAWSGLCLVLLNNNEFVYMY